MPDQADILLEQTYLLISRLERLSADSIWAHRASGMRGALLKLLTDLEDNPADLATLTRLKQNLSSGYWLLEKAARELIE